jgi:hypothetical protein
LFLQNRFYSITCDHWTSLANENYGALTLHLIDDFELKTFVMSCVKHENGTTAVEVERQLINDLNQWELQQKQLICCVTDTAANMNAFGTSILPGNNVPLLNITTVLTICFSSLLLSVTQVLLTKCFVTMVKMMTEPFLP